MEKKGLSGGDMLWLGLMFMVIGAILLGMQDSIRADIRELKERPCVGSVK